MSEVVTQGFDLVIYGMGTVFVFLTILVLLTMLMSMIVKSDPEPIPATSASNAPVDSRTLAVIHAAVQQYRRKHRA